MADGFLSQEDFGDSLLAEIDNARFAIQLGDRVAAYNDIGEALAFARQLTNRPSTLLPSRPLAIQTSKPGVSQAALSPTRMTAFDAQVKLGSARAELENRPEAADADLRDIQRGIPAQLISNDLQLLRAAASLSLSRNAVREGRIPELSTQLLTARTALDAYVGPAHVAEARALAATIGGTLKQAETLRTIPSSRLSSWLGLVIGWAGSERWKALWPDVTDHHQSNLP